jgi:phosphatidylinositol alpha-1,6-mannosyltransferase
MRILIFTLDFPPLTGGISIYSHGVTEGLSQLGEEITVLTQHSKNDFEFDRYQRFKVIRVSNIIILREILLFLWFIYIVRRFKIQHVINLVWMPCGAISFFVSRILNFSYYVVAFGAEIFDANTLLKSKIKKKFKWLMQLTFNNANKCFPISNYTKAILQKNGIGSSKLLVVPGGVDLSKFNSNIDYKEIIKKYGLLNKKIILTVARLDEHKGHDLVIQSLPEVLEKIPDLVYLIVGDGPEKKRLKELVAGLGLEDKVVFIGSVPHDETPKFFGLCDVFIMPSRELRLGREWFEGFGIVYLEAGACSKPVIGGASGGISDAIIESQTGILVDPNRVQDISGALKLLLTDKKYAVMLGEKGRERIKSNFSWQIIAKRIDTVMQKTDLARQGFKTTRVFEPSDTVKKILLVELAGIGDTVLSSIAIKNLARRYHNSIVYFLTFPRPAQLVSKSSYLSRTFVFYKGIRGFLKNILVLNELRGLNIDVAVNLYQHYTLRGVINFFLILKFIRPKEIIGRNTDGKGFFYDIKIDDSINTTRHDVEYKLDLIEALGCDIKDKELEVWFDDSDTQAVRKFLEKKSISDDDILIGLHPGARIPTHRWNWENFAYVADELANRYKAKVIITGFEAERELVKKIGIKMSHQPIVALSFSLTQLAALIKRCNLYISNDTAPMHIANALKTHLVAIMGPGSMKTAPYQEENCIILKKDTECAPCTKFRCRSMKCLNNITTDMVIEASEKLLKLR